MNRKLLIYWPCGLCMLTMDFTKIIYSLQHKHGWRFQKRPGLDILLSQIGYPNFELVIYTVEQPMTFFNVIDGIDPHNQYINYRLFRDATRSVGTNKHPTKDVASLNRDPKKVNIQRVIRKKKYSNNNFR